MIVKYPVTAISRNDRIGVCFRLDELLRIEHNEMSAKFKAGEITEGAFKDYIKNEFEVMTNAIHAEINIYRTGGDYQNDELLRLEHNAMGAKFKAGEITEAVWKAYLKNDFEPKSRTIHARLNVQREVMSKSTFWPITLKTSVLKEAGEL